jgi:hypothetical protein
MFEHHHNIKSSWVETVPSKRDSDYFTSAIEQAHIDYKNSQDEPDFYIEILLP